MPLDPNIDYEHLPPGTEFDETDVNLRYYLCKLSDEKLMTYDPDMSDEELMEWSGEFTSDGNLMLTCSERDVDVHEFRAVLEEHIRHRNLPEDPLAR